MAKQVSKYKFKKGNKKPIIQSELEEQLSKLCACNELKSKCLCKNKKLVTDGKTGKINVVDKG